MRPASQPAFATPSDVRCWEADTSVSDVGIIVNPWAGKDIRRLHAPVGHSPDTAKIGIVRRIAIGALEAGASRVIATRDVGRIAERALAGVDGAHLVDGPGTGSALDSRRGATQLAELGCAPIVVLGGDGTCRDVALGAPHTTMIAISTGTNNVFPVHARRLVCRYGSRAHRRAAQSLSTRSGDRQRSSISTSNGRGTPLNTTSHLSMSRSPTTVTPALAPSSAPSRSAP